MSGALSRRMIVLGLVVWACWASPIFAQPASPPPTLEQAREAFLDGMRLVEEQKWGPASERFLYAARARRTPGLLYHAAFCLEKQERYAQALALYEEARDVAREQPAADVEALLPDALARTEAALPLIHLVGLPSESRVEVDGQVQVQLPTVRLDPGAYEIVVRAPGREPFQTTLTLARAERVEVAVKFPPSPKSVGPKETGAPTSQERRPPVAKPYVVGSAAVLSAVGLGLGIYGTVHSARLGQRQEELGEAVDEASGDGSSGCVEPDSDLVSTCQELEKTHQRRNVAQALMIAGYTTFGLGLFAAVGTQLLWKPLPVQVSWQPGGGMLKLSGSF